MTIDAIYLDSHIGCYCEVLLIRHSRDPTKCCCHQHHHLSFGVHRYC